MSGEPPGEVGVVTCLARRPQHLGEGAQPGKHHVLRPLRVGDVFGPQLSLCPEHVVRLSKGQGGRHGLERVHRVERQEAADRERLGDRVGGLIVIEIGMRSGGHHHVVPRLCRRDAAVHAAPRHDHRVGREAALENLVPPHEPATVCREELVHATREPALQLVLALEAELADPRLRERARLPLGLRGLVAAHMDPAVGEQRHHLGEDVLLELYRRVCGIQDVLVHAPGRPDGKRVAAVAELGIRGNGGLGMAGHLDLGHDRHEAGAGVGDDLADIVLRVEATVRLAVEPPSGRILVRPPDDRLPAPGAHLGEPRVLLDLEAPPLVVGQVPVEAVELMQRRELDVLLHELFGHEVPSHVEVHAAPREPGHILDRDRGDAPRDAAHLALPEDRGREELAQRPDPVERARGSVGANRDA